MSLGLIGCLPEIDQRLAGIGFVHVTGLPFFNSLRPDEDDCIQTHRREFGCWDHNNGLTAAVTEGGNIWLRYGFLGERESRIIGRVCPKGRGAWVPCSSGGYIPTHLLLMRVKDPYSDMNGQFSPNPQPKD